MAKTKAKSKKKDEPKKGKGISSFQGKPIVGDVPALAVIELSRDLLVIRVSQFKGRKALDIRRFWDAGAEWAPGKGVNISIGHAKEFMEAINRKEVSAAIARASEGDDE